jgi:hypothetical protein
VIRSVEKPTKRNAVMDEGIFTMEDLSDGIYPRRDDGDDR